MIFKSILELSALILGLVNGIILLRNYLRDKPKLSVSPIYPNIYQWFFALPNKDQSQTIRKYGFLTYLSIINRGFRDVSLDSWCLHLKTVGGKWVELNPMSISEPQIELGQSGNLKVYPVLGQKGLYHNEDIMIKAGSSISGFAYFIANFFGEDSWNPLLMGGKAIGKIEVKSIFGNKAGTKILFTKISLEKAKKMVEDIDKIDF